MSSNRVMEGVSGKVQNPRTHGASSFIMMYLAAVEIHHCAAAGNSKAATLPREILWKRHLMGDGIRFREGSEGKHVLSVSAQSRYAIGNVREGASNGVMEEG